MKKARSSEQQIAFALRQADGGSLDRDVCRKMGISKHTLLPVVEEVRRSWATSENHKLKQLVAGHRQAGGAGSRKR